MTHREKIIATAYTGIMFVDGEHFDDVYKYEKEKLGHGVIDIMHADKEFLENVREAVKEDFIHMIHGELLPQEPNGNYKNLTWEDIRQIVQTADMVLEEMDKKELLTFGQQFYYNAVLERVTLMHNSNAVTDRQA